MSQHRKLQRTRAALDWAPGASCCTAGTQWWWQVAATAAGGRAAGAPRCLRPPTSDMTACSSHTVSRTSSISFQSRTTLPLFCQKTKSKSAKPAWTVHRREVRSSWQKARSPQCRRSRCAKM